MRLKLYLAALGVPLLVGCQSGFEQFYKGSRCKPVENAQCVTSQPQGTWCIGASHFISAAGEGASDAVAAAKAVGADYVVWTSDYKGTSQSSGAVPFTTPTSSTTTYQANTYGNVYGNSGYAGSYNANTYGTATTYGTQTTYIPYTVVNHWFQYSAWFYRSNHLGAR